MNLHPNYSMCDLNSPFQWVEAASQCTCLVLHEVDYKHEKMWRYG